MQTQPTTTANPASAQAKPRPRNWLLIKFREWHIWLGVALSLFIIIVCVTGIYLNHEWLKLIKGEAYDKPKPGQSGVLTTSTDLTTHPVSFAAALARARELWGNEVPIQHVHLNAQQEALTYKIKARGQDREITIDAFTGALTEKNGYKQDTQIHPQADIKRGVNWGKVMKDLHTGKLGGEAGKLLIDFTSIIIVGLTVTGIYLWVVPKWRKRRAAKIAVTQTASQPAPRAGSGRANRDQVYLGP